MFNTIKKLLIISTIFFIAAASYAQIEVVRETGDADEFGQNPVTESDLPLYQLGAPDYDQVWKSYKEMMLRNDYDNAIADVSRLMTLKESRRLERLTFYAMALTADAYLFYKKTGDKERANQLYEIAQSLDPKLPDAYFFPFAMEMRWGVGFFSHIGNFVKGIKASFDDPFNRLSAYSIIINLSIRSLVLAGLLFTLLLFYKFQRNLRYDAAMLDVFGNSESMKKFAGWFFLILPFVFWLGFEYIMLYLIVILLPYSKPSLKIAGIIVLLGLVIYVPCLKYNNAVLQTINDENVRFTLLAEKSFYTHDLGEKVSEHRKHDKNNLYLEMTQARVLMYYGRLSDAYNAFRILNKKYPNRIDILITLGNIRYYNGSYELAKLHYEEAMRLDPGNVAALYNYKLTVEQLDPFRDTSDLKRQIINLDPKFYESLAASEGEKKDLLEIYLPEGQKTAECNEILMNYLFEGDKEASISKLLVSNVLSIMSIAGIIGFLILTSLKKKNGHAEKCQKCLRVFRQQTRGDDVESKYCKQCVSIFFKKEGVSPEVQRAKIVQINQIRKKERTSKLLISLFVPGARNIYSDRGISGFLTLWKWILLILVLTSGSSLHIYPFSVVDLPFGPMKLLALILLLQTQITSIFLGFIRMNKGD
jgi:tetratricopeptide (TPR) repeat protein